MIRSNVIMIGVGNPSFIGGECPKMWFQRINLILLIKNYPKDLSYLPDVEIPGVAQVKQLLFAGMFDFYQYVLYYMFVM